MNSRKLVSISDIEYIGGLVKSARKELANRESLRCDAFLHSAEMALCELLPEPQPEVKDTYITHWMPLPEPPKDVQR